MVLFINLAIGKFTQILELINIFNWLDGDSKCRYTVLLI